MTAINSSHEPTVHKSVPTEMDSRAWAPFFHVSPYVSSGPGEDLWGQPPARHYVFRIEGDILQGQLISDAEGVYIPSRLTEPASGMDSPLGLELEAWDTLSDEAWANFEQELG